ncbi:NAD-dependent aldehyde dehydrogenase [Trichoderma harzianum]|uniref:NAD-dependent aldehyde dehydrogenase n=1 Tax=Trichoderma harzianum TaxID=5544 RepID=A0A0F9XED3_TRIHA|nr:NAD-dependent aldehyde dehydrogenase [Trichoderma harzianum]
MFYYSHTEIGVNREEFNHEHGVASACRSIADLIQVVTTSTSPVIAASGRSALVVKEPYGVVLGIFSPEHSPCPGATGLPAAACYGHCRGNTVVLKGPEAAPGTMWRIPSALHDAGLPAGCLNTLDHVPKDTGIIISSPNASSTNSNVAEEFCKVLLLALKDSSDTQGWDVAQLVSNVAVINNKKLIADALSKGAQLLADDMGHGIESASKLRLTIITASERTWTSTTRNASDRSCHCWLRYHLARK